MAQMRFESSILWRCKKEKLEKKCEHGIKAMNKRQWGSTERMVNAS